MHTCMRPRRVGLVARFDSVNIASIPWSSSPRGQFEAEFAQLTEKANGLLFSEKEILEFNHIAEECGAEPWKISDFAESET